MPRRGLIYRDDDMVICPACGGTGRVPDPQDDLENQTCPLCGGEGRVHRSAAARFNPNRVPRRQEQHTEQAPDGTWI